MTDTITLRSVSSDAELLLATRAGNGDAYGELYVRHLQSARAAAGALTRSRADADDIVAEAFSRVLSVVQRGGGPEISFRPYLLTAVRNSFYERMRKVRLEDPTDTPDDAVNVVLLEAASSADDRAMIAAAFASLPERWQLVLWHTEVEGRSAAEVAPLLGIAANAVAALSYRAREGLREAYLQSHLQQPMAAGCQECVANLGAYVRDSLPARDRRAVDEHLATCTSCPALLAELSDANTRLRAVLIPLIVGVPAAKYLAGLSAGKGVLGSLRRMPRSQQTVVGAIAASMVAALVLVGVVIANNDDTQRIVADDSANVEDSIGSGSSSASTPVSSVFSAATNPNDDGSSVDDVTVSSDGFDPFDTVDTTPSNTLAATDDTIDIYTYPPSDDGSVTPYFPPYVPGTTQRTTAGTSAGQPRPGPIPSRPTVPTSSTQEEADSGATYPTVQPTTPATPTEPSAAPTSAPTTSSSTSTTTAPVVPPAPQVGAEIIGRAYTNGKALVRINAANGTAPGGGASLRSARRAGAASSVRVTMTLPAGVGFDRVDDPSWACSADATTLSCVLPALADQQKSSADIELTIGAAVTDFSISPTITADGGSPVSAASPTLVEVSTIDGSIFADYDTGSVTIIGNSNMTCDEATVTTCVAARAGQAGGDDDNRQAQDMIHRGAVDGAFNSSTATLTLGGATVTKAYLVWGGDIALGSTSAPAPASNNTVRISNKAGGSLDVVADHLTTWTDGSLYAAYADVTSFVRTEGVYQVSNIQAAQGREGLAGWSLVVVTHRDTDPVRLLAVVNPDALLRAPSDQPSGPPATYLLDLAVDAGAHPLTVAIASYEGDFGISGDNLKIGTDATITNAFDSSVIGATDPANLNNFGIGSTLRSTTITTGSLRIEARSAQDQVQIPVVAFSFEL